MTVVEKEPRTHTHTSKSGEIGCVFFVGCARAMLLFVSADAHTAVVLERVRVKQINSAVPVCVVRIYNIIIKMPNPAQHNAKASVGSQA